MASDRLQAAEALLIEEARQLDSQDYRAWGEMWTEDGLYVVPSDVTTEDFLNSLNYICDDSDMRRRRIERLLSDTTLVMTPPTRTMRMISCVRFLGPQSDDSCRIASSLLVVASRLGQQTIFAAHVDHGIIWTPSGPRINRKIVRLINADQALTDFSFLL